MATFTLAAKAAHERPFDGVKSTQVPEDASNEDIYRLYPSLRRAALLKQQADILRREFLRADAEGIDARVPAMERWYQEQSRKWPRLSREDAWARHQENQREQLRRWRERDRAKGSRGCARQRGATVSGRFGLADIVARDGHACYLCGDSFPEDDLQIEHVIPIAAGGAHEFTNVALACRPCNSRKSARFVAFRVDTRRPVYLW